MPPKTAKAKKVVIDVEAEAEESPVMALMGVIPSCPYCDKADFATKASYKAHLTRRPAYCLQVEEQKKKVEVMKASAVEEEPEPTDTEILAEAIDEMREDIQNMSERIVKMGIEVQKIKSAPAPRAKSVASGVSGMTRNSQLSSATSVPDDYVPWDCSL